jgi:16S rRNA (guanine1207-N2)-methyltransferase
MPSHSADPVLDTLCLLFAEGALDWPAAGQALFLRARWGVALQDVPKAKIICEQSFKPEHDRLVDAGFTMGTSDDKGGFDLTLVLPPRQRDEARVLLARAVSEANNQGIVCVCVSNLEGAKTVEGDLKALTGNVTSLSKNKCRVFWSRINYPLTDQSLISLWISNDAPREVNGGYLSRPGLFAWDRLDAGSTLLLKHLPTGLSGRGADLGAGFGYLSDEVLKRYTDVSRIDLYEAELRALEMAKHNLAEYGERAVFHWQDVTRGIDPGYDFIISNPPFHTDRADRNSLGQAFIAAAAKGLKPAGQFWMVANRHLPYEETLKGHFKTVALIKDDGAYKVFKAIKGK